MNEHIILFDENSIPYIAHHGIKGQKWGIRRFQNADGTLTEAGRKRHNRMVKRFNKISNSSDRQFDKANKYSRKATHQKIGNSHRNAEIARRAMSKAVKNTKRASRIYKKLKKDYADKSVASLEQNTIIRGEQMIERYRMLSLGQL